MTGNHCPDWRTHPALHAYERCAVAACLGDFGTFVSAVDSGRPISQLRTSRRRRLIMKESYIMSSSSPYGGEFRREEERGCANFFSAVLSIWDAAVSYARYASTHERVPLPW